MRRGPRACEATTITFGWPAADVRARARSRRRTVGKTRTTTTPPRPPFDAGRQYNHTDCETSTGKTFTRAISVARPPAPRRRQARSRPRPPAPADPASRRPPAVPPPPWRVRGTTVEECLLGGGWRCCTLSNLFHFPFLCPDRPNVALRRRRHRRRRRLYRARRKKLL